jgi:hypothetical protein
MGTVLEKGKISLLTNVNPFLTFERSKISDHNIGVGQSSDTINVGTRRCGSHIYEYSTKLAFQIAQSSRSKSVVMCAKDGK